MSKQINILDGFSGIGGFSLAIQRAGFKINKHYASELDKYAQMIYRRNFNGSIQLGDITKVGNDLGKIDIATFGFPCQAFSIAGKRRGFSDTRGTLFFEIERLARFYKPSYLVLENVKGLFSHEGGNTFRTIMDSLRGLDYTIQALLLNTKDFGIPQNRERIFFICTARGKRQPEISSIRERKTEIAFSANCIDANYYKGIDNHRHKDGEGFREVKSGLCPTILARAREDGSGQPIISIPVLSPDRVEKRQNGRRFKENDEPAFTLTAQDRHGIYNGEIIRRLTPVECERLQDYQDGWTKYGIDEAGKEVEISDTQRYKTLGNSISVIVAQKIFKSIRAVI